MNSLHALMGCAHNHLEKELDIFVNSTKSNGNMKTKNNLLAFI